MLFVIICQNYHIFIQKRTSKYIKFIVSLRARTNNETRTNWKSSARIITVRFIKNYAIPFKTTRSDKKEEKNINLVNIRYVHGSCRCANLPNAEGSGVATTLPVCFHRSCQRHLISRRPRPGGHNNIAKHCSEIAI